MKLLIGLIVFAHLISACGQKRTESYSKAMNDSIRHEVQKYTILNDSRSIPLTSEGWTPENEQIHSLVLLLRRAIKENQSDYNRHLKPGSLLNYYLQYICYVKNGDSIVLVNAFCRVPDDYRMDDNGNLKITRFDWQHSFVQVMDGGGCYWQSTINFSKRKILAFMVNGEA